MLNIYRQIALKIALLASLCAASSAYAANTVIDVLAVYTPGGAAAYGGDPTTRINQLFQMTNQIYKDSGVDLEIRLAGTQQVDYTDDNSADTALNDITKVSNPVFAGIAAKREAVKADMVILYRPFKQVQGSCGLAWIGNDPSNPGYKGYMFSHIAMNYCPDFVTAHELGHNMGLTHSRKQDGKGGAYPYATGYGVDGQFVTIMAYATAFNVDYWTGTIYKFSQPGLTCKGVPCGVDRNDPVNGADAHYAINQTGPIIANYYQGSASASTGSTSSTDALSAANNAVEAAKAAVDNDKAAIAANKAAIATKVATEASKKAELTAATALATKAKTAYAAAAAKYKASTTALDALRVKAAAALTAFNASTDKTRAANKTKYDTAVAAVSAKESEVAGNYNAVATAQAALDSATAALAPLTDAYTAAKQASLNEKALTAGLNAKLATDTATYTAAVKTYNTLLAASKKQK